MFDSNDSGVAFNERRLVSRTSVDDDLLWNFMVVSHVIKNNIAKAVMAANVPIQVCDRTA